MKRERAVVAYVGALAVAGVGTAFAHVALYGAPTNVPWGHAPAFLVLLAASAYLILRIGYRDHVMALDLFESVLAGALVAFSGPIVIGMAAVAHVIVESVNRNRPLKAAFNVAQWTVATGAGALVFDALRTDPSVTARTAGALVAALAVVACVNLLAFPYVLHLAQGQPFTAVIRDVAPSILAGWGLNVAFGLLLAVAYQWSVAALALFGVLLLVLHGAYRGYAAAVSDRKRIEALSAAARTLAEPVDPREAFADFLESVRSSFDAATVDLVLNEGDRRMRHRVSVRDGYRRALEDSHDATLASTLVDLPEPQLLRAHPSFGVGGALLRAEGWRSCIAAPVVVEDRPVGVLCVYDPSGPESDDAGDRALVGALSVEVAHALHKATLLDRMFEERRTLSDIVGASSDGIATLNAEGQVQTWNPAFERITGYRAIEMIGARNVDRLHARDRDGGIVLLERWAERRAFPPADLQIVTKDGAASWLSCSYSQVVDADAGTRSLVLVARDATKAREVEQLKDDFVATVSHELRTPLTPIKGWADVLLRAGERLSVVEREAAAISIKSQAERLERLITNLLEVSRIESGIGDPASGTFDVGSLVRRVVDEFRAMHPDRTISIVAQGGDLFAGGDDVWAERILANLLSNALKYSADSEPVELRVRAVGDEVEIAVRDRGPGISAADRERVFERFRRLGDHMTRETQGTGLGLYIARRLAEAIGASLTVESDAGNGSTFTMRAPRTSRSKLASAS